MITSLFGTENSPDIIIGKYDMASVNPALKKVYGDDFFKSFGNIQVNKYEFWFSSTISFIPYAGQPVFVADITGNIKHSGDRLTNGVAVINKTLTVKDDTKLEKNADVTGKLTVTDDVETKKDVRITGNLFVQGTIFNSAVGGDVVTDIEKIKQDILDIKEQLKNLSEKE